MPIALSTIQLPQNISTISGGGDHGGKSEGAAARRSATPETRQAENDAARGERVTLAAGGASTDAAYVLAAPYAEIWKDGRKVAEIDSRGDVSSFNGLVAAPLGGGIGLSLAAQRTALIARSIGGEIRVAGLVTDVSALTMHTRLREAYGT